MMAMKFLSQVLCGGSRGFGAYTLGVSVGGFTAGAAGSISNQPKQDCWVINDQNKLDITQYGF